MARECKNNSLQQTNNPSSSHSPPHLIDSIMAPFESILNTFYSVEKVEERAFRNLIALTLDKHPLPAEEGMQSSLKKGKPTLGETSLYASAVLQALQRLSLTRTVLVNPEHTVRITPVLDGEKAAIGRCEADISSAWKEEVDSNKEAEYITWMDKTLSPLSDMSTKYSRDIPGLFSPTTHIGISTVTEIARATKQSKTAKEALESMEGRKAYVKNVMDGEERQRRPLAEMLSSRGYPMASGAVDEVK